MRVLWLTQAINEGDWLRDFMVRWVCAMAQRVDRLEIITQEYRGATLPDNVRVHSLGKEGGASRAAQAARLYALAARLVPRVDAVFGHITQRQAWMISPLTRLHRKPLVIWYCHNGREARTGEAPPPEAQGVDWEIRLAARVADDIVTAVPSSFPIPGPKVHPIGHGIDTEFFRPADAPAPDQDDGLPLVIHVARIGEIKNQLALVRALGRGLPARAALIGGTPPEAERYAERIRRLSEELGIADRVEFVGGVPPVELLGWYRRARAGVNLTRLGSFDKAVLEGMACGLPTVVSHEAFRPTMGRWAPRLEIPHRDDDAALADRLAYLLEQPEEERREMAADLRQGVVEQHSIGHLMDQIVELLRR